MTAREQLIADSFVALTDTLVAGFELRDFLSMLVERTVPLVHADAGGVVLADQRGGLQVMAASSSAVRLLELVQLQHGEGPCVDAFRTGRAVTRDDPAAMQAAWPRYAPRLAEAGYASAQAVPMRLREEVIGALDVFRAGPGALGDADLELARALADVATVGIVQQRLRRAGDLLAEQLQHALTSRVLIEQAKGVLAERAGIDPDAAFALLRRYARSHGRPLAQVVQGVLDGTLRLPG